MSGALAHSPADILRYLLIDLGHGTLPSDGALWPIYESQEPNLPDNVITTYNTTNVHQGRVMSDGEVQERYGIQIRVRATTELIAFVKSQAITISLDQDVYLKGVTINGSGYLVHAVSRISGPMSIGKETPDSKRDLFTINVTAAIRQS